MMDASVVLGSLRLRSPLIAASGTVGSVWEWAGLGTAGYYGAAVAKSVSGEPWPGRPVPRLAPAGIGMLNGIGIQNPGIEAWVVEVSPHFGGVGVPVWGSAVGTDADEFAMVAKGLSSAGVVAIEINLSCPNIEAGTMFALDATESARVVAAVKANVTVPLVAKLSPNAMDIVEIAAAVVEAGADSLTLTNTVSGMGIDIATRRPRLSGGVGGYSGPPIKPIAMRCVWEVHQALPEVPLIGCGGIRRGSDVVEYLMAGASAVAMGTVHFAEPKAGRRIHGELARWCRRNGVEAVADLTGTVRPW